jgi:uncharacterized membrane protein YesL
LFHWLGADAGSLYWCFTLLGVPGFAPAGALLFFASPKKSKQKKGEPNALSLRFATGTLRCSV